MQNYNHSLLNFRALASLSVLVIFVNSAHAVVSLPDSAGTKDVKKSQKSAPKKQRQKQLEINKNDLVGKWVGTYTCGQGTTNAEFTIDEQLNSVFRFYSTEKSALTFDGQFAGKTNISNGLVSFKPNNPTIDNWTVPPNGNLNWYTISFNANLGKSKSELSGKVLDPNCTEIQLYKF